MLQRDDSSTFASCYVTSETKSSVRSRNMQSTRNDRNIDKKARSNRSIGTLNSTKYKRLKPRRLLLNSLRALLFSSICQRKTKTEDSSYDEIMEQSTDVQNQRTISNDAPESKENTSSTPPSLNGFATIATSSDDHVSSSDSRRRSCVMAVDLRTKSRSKRKLEVVKSLLTSRQDLKKGFSGIFTSTNMKSASEYLSMVDGERLLDWLYAFRRLDPRYQILKFFHDVAREGASNIEEAECKINEEALTSPILRGFSRASAFSVWRPTSNDAIRKMMSGEATGKGLDIKGKSAKKGKLSGFIPFLQIHEEEHKNKVRWPPKDAKIRIYYKSEAARNRAMLELISVSNEMETTVFAANLILSKSSNIQPEQYETAVENMKFDVADFGIHALDCYSPSYFGFLVCERIFFNTYISKQDISRCSDYETGRLSQPTFQDMNFKSTRKYKGSGPRAVVLQLSENEEEALSPQSLVVAYEENNKITPVASDFDCFLVGTRGVTYESPLPDEQVKLVKWLLSQIDSILQHPESSVSWTCRWLEVLKESARKGFHPEMPEFGFGDPKSYAIMEDVVSRLGDSGAVRHGAECFNYFTPQELDDEFLVVSDDLGGAVRWRNVNVNELQDILCERIDQGFTFPLNPKWILADRGWKAVYDKMMASNDETIQKSLAVWYPPGSGIRESIEDIYTRYPDGFHSVDIQNSNENCKKEGFQAMDLAQQELDTYIILRRAKVKLRCIIMLKKLIAEKSHH